MNPKKQIIVRVGENFHCLTSTLSLRGHYADEVWLFGEFSEAWDEALAPLLAKVAKENIHYITAT